MNKTLITKNHIIIGGALVLLLLAKSGSSPAAPPAASNDGIIGPFMGAVVIGLSTLFFL